MMKMKNLFNKDSLCPHCHSNYVREAGEYGVYFHHKDGDCIAYGRYLCGDCDSYFIVEPERYHFGEPSGISTR